MFETSQETSVSSFSFEKSKHRQKVANASSSSPKNIRRNYCQQVSFNGNTSSELDRSDVSPSDFLNKSREELTCEKGVTSPGIIPKQEQVTCANELEILADVHSFCIQGIYNYAFL